MERNRKLPPLRALQAFEAGARLGNFTRAGEELHVTQTAISHQVRTLEAFYQQKLFDRTFRDITVTEAGARLQAASTDIFDQLDRVTQELLTVGANESAPLRVTLPPALGSRWLAPRLGCFWSEHAMELNFIPSSTLLDFQLENIDVGIRCGDGIWPGLESEFLMPMTMTPVCSPSLLIERPGLKSPADLGNYTLLHELNYDAWGEWLATSKVTSIEHQRGVICQDAAMLYDLTIRGQGIALGSTTVLSAEFTRGELITPFAGTHKVQGGYFLVYRKASLANNRVRQFREFVLRESRDSRGESAIA